MPVGTPSDPDSMIFTSKNEIFLYNFETQLKETVYKLTQSFKDPVKYFTIGPNQSIFQIASDNDGLYVNLE